MEEHLEVEDLDIVVLDRQRDLLEAAFAAPDADHVAVDAEADALLAEQLPVAVAAVPAVAVAAITAIASAVAAITVAWICRGDVRHHRHQKEQSPQR